MFRKMKSEAGIGLMSTMVAMVLLGLAVTALSSSGMMVLAVHTDSAVRSSATALAASYLEEVKARDPQALASESAAKINEAGIDETTGPYIRSLEVIDEPGLAYTKRISVLVQYPRGRGRMGRVELITVIYVGEDR